MTRQPTPANILDAVLTTDATGPDRTALRARLRWDYGQVAPVDRKAVEDAAVDILANGQRMQQSAVAVGERLIAVKRLLGHGQFGDWCATEFSMSQKTAENLMNVAREFGDKIETVSIFTNSAMYMLAAPSTPEPARQQAIAEAHATGKSPTKERVREIIAGHKPAPAPQPGTPFTDKQVAEFVTHYFGPGTLQRIADAPSPPAAMRNEMDGNYYSSSPRCKGEFSKGKVRAWHIDNGPLFDREPDEVWTAFEFVTLSLPLLPPRSAISNQQSPISNYDPDVAANAEAATVQIIEYETVDTLPPADAPLPAWADEPISKPGQSTADYLAYRSMALANGEAYLNLKEWRQWLDNGAPVIDSDADYTARQPHDDRLPAAQRLMALYGAVIDSEDEYGNLTGRFSDTLAVKRDLTHMISHLSDLIAAITHPEEEPPAAD